MGALNSVFLNYQTFIAATSNPLRSHANVLLYSYTTKTLHPVVLQLSPLSICDPRVRKWIHAPTERGKI